MTFRNTENENGDHSDGFYTNSSGFTQFPLTRYLILPILICFVLIGSEGGSAQPFQSAAPHAILIDADSGTVLYEKAADDPMPPASMAKVLTVAVVFDLIKQGQISLDDEFLITEYAWRTGGAPSGTSTMYAEINSNIRLVDLLRGIVIQSANDACIAIAEGISGTELGFAQLMNKYAEKIGMTNSTFANSTGLPDPAQRVTARDLATLAAHVIDAYPEYYPLFSEPEFTWNKIRQRNRNPLLNTGIGVDGLKTGHTRESGYGLVASSLNNGQRLIAVVNGLKTSKARSEESRKLLSWGYRSFEAVALSEKDGFVAEARVFGGAKRRVGLTGFGGRAVKILLPRGSRGRIKAKVIYQGPVPAPVKIGQPVGALTVWRDDAIIQKTPLYAGEDVAVGGLIQRALDAVGELLIGWW